MKHAYAGSQETVIAAAGIENIIGQDGIDTNLGTETIITAGSIDRMARSEGIGGA